MPKRVVHISEKEAVTTNVATLLEHVRAGAEVIIENDSQPVAVIRSADPNLRLLSESLRMARERKSTATLDGGFAKDLEAVIESHQEPLNPPEWD